MLFFKSRSARPGFLHTRRAIALICALTLCASLLSACAPLQNDASEPVSDTSAPPAVDAAQGLVEEAPGRFVATTRKGVDELYTSERISDDAYSLINSLLGGASLRKRLPVEISAFKLVWEETQPANARALPFSFTVTRSDVSTLPPGDYEKELFDGGQVLLRDPADANIPPAR